MWFFYLVAFLMVGVGGYLWATKKTIVWQEWLGGSAIAFIMAVSFQYAAFRGMTADVETLSDQLTKVIHHPYWMEHYTTQEAVYTGTGKNRRFSHYKTVHHWVPHPEHWEGVAGIGSFSMSKSMWLQIGSKFGGKLVTERPYKPNFESGDRNIYVYRNETGWVEPCTRANSFVNRIKAAPTVFSFSKVPTNQFTYAYPENGDWNKSDRLFGTASAIDLLAFDQMNARLGPTKKVNVIMIGFGNRGSDAAEWQRSKWIGGKKNDIVICYGGGTAANPEWAKVFGWSDGDVCKRRLESIVLEGPVNTSILPKIEQEIRQGYTLKDWSQFDYISIEPPSWSYWVYFLVVGLAQGGFWFWAHVNEYGKVDSIHPRNAWRTVYMR